MWSINFVSVWTDRHPSAALKALLCRTTSAFIVWTKWHQCGSGFFCGSQLQNSGMISLWSHEPSSFWTIQCCCKTLFTLSMAVFYSLYHCTYGNHSGSAWTVVKHYTYGWYLPIQNFTWKSDRHIIKTDERGMKTFWGHRSYFHKEKPQHRCLLFTYVTKRFISKEIKVYPCIRGYLQSYKKYLHGQSPALYKTLEHLFHKRPIPKS